jgi:hypothetical protein
MLSLYNARDMETKYIILIIVALLVVSGGFVFVIRRPAPTPAPTKPITRRPVPPTAPPTVPPTVAPTSPPPSTLATNTMVPAYDVYGAALAPMPPPLYAVAAMPQYHLVPGAAWPVLVGRNRETVSYWLMNTYPRLNVRALPFGSPTFYEARNDRITVLYDPYTNRVVNARIG